MKCKTQNNKGFSPRKCCSCPSEFFHTAATQPNKFSWNHLKSDMNQVSRLPKMCFSDKWLCVVDAQICSELKRAPFPCLDFSSGSPNLLFSDILWHWKCENPFNLPQWSCYEIEFRVTFSRKLSVANLNMTSDTWIENWEFPILQTTIIPVVLPLPDEEWRHRRNTHEFGDVPKGHTKNKA